MPWKNMNALNSYTKLRNEEAHAKSKFADHFTDHLAETNRDSTKYETTKLQLKRWFQRWERIVKKMRQHEYFSREPEHIVPFTQRYAYNKYLCYKGFPEKEINEIDVTGPVYTP